MPIEWSQRRTTPDRLQGPEHWFANIDNQGRIGLELDPEYELVFPGAVQLRKNADAANASVNVSPFVDFVKGLASEQLRAGESRLIPFLFDQNDVTAILDEEFTENVNPDLEVKVRLCGMPIVRPKPNEDGTNLKPSPGAPENFGVGIARVIVVIDADIAFAHERFLHPTGGTRIAWFWDMDADKYTTLGGRGRFMYRDNIQNYLNKLRDPAFGERDLYKSYIQDSYQNPIDALLPSVYGHGTHVLDMAAGNSPDGAGHDPHIDDNTAIFAIQLPRAAVAQTHGYFLGDHITAAFFWTWYHANRISVTQNDTYPEVFVNMSVGGHAGRHDGFSKIERMMDEYLTDTPFRQKLVDAVFLPAGNSFDTRTHARLPGRVIKTDSPSVKWRIRPDDGTASFLEIWTPVLPDLPDDQLHKLSCLTITSPAGLAREFKDEDGELDPGTYHELTDTDGAVLARLYVDDDSGRSEFDNRKDRRRRRYLLAIRHTQRNREAQGGYKGGRPDLAGDWTVKVNVRPNFPDNQMITFWIARDDEILRFKTGAKQSIFPEIVGELDEIQYPAAADRPDGIVNDGTISDMAAGTKTCVIAAHLESDRTPAEYSGEGIDANKATAGRDIHPTASAIADQSKAHSGLIASGYFSGSTFRQGGTSVSSPLALRHMLGARRAPPDTIKSVLEQTAALHDPVVPVDPDRPGASRIGHGRINADAGRLPCPKRRRASRP